MPATTLPGGTISTSALSMIWKQTYVTQGLNQKALSQARGIVRGFKPQPSAFVLTLDLIADDIQGDSVAVVAPVSGGGLRFALTYRVAGNMSLDLSTLAGQTIYIGIKHSYTIGIATTAAWVWYPQADYDAGVTNEAVLVCRVVVPGAGVIPLANISTLFYRDEQWKFDNDKLGAQVPVLTLNRYNQLNWYGMEKTTSVQVTGEAAATGKFGRAAVDYTVAGAIDGTVTWNDKNVAMVVGGTRIGLSVWAKKAVGTIVNAVATKVTANFYWDGFSPLSTTDYLFGPEITTSWKLLRKEVVVPANARYVVLSVQLVFNTGTVTLDSAAVWAQRQSSDTPDGMDVANLLVGSFAQVSGLSVTPLGSLVNWQLDANVGNTLRWTTTFGKLFGFGKRTGNTVDCEMGVRQVDSNVGGGLARGIAAMSPTGGRLQAIRMDSTIGSLDQIGELVFSGFLPDENTDEMGYDGAFVRARASVGWTVGPNYLTRLEFGVGHGDGVTFSEADIAEIVTHNGLGQLQHKFLNQTPSNADGGRLISLQFSGFAVGPTEYQHAEIQVEHDGALGDQKGRFEFRVNDGTGAYKTALKLASSGRAFLSYGDMQDLAGPANGENLRILNTGEVFRDSAAFTEYHYYEAHDGQDLLRGDAVVLVNGKIEKATHAEDSRVVGLVSERPGKWMRNNSLSGERHDRNYAIAAVGDARDSKLQGFKVCNDNGPIHAGDLLVTSSRPGYLMRQMDDLVRSCTVGKAMEDVSFDENGLADGVYGFLYCG